MRAKLFPTLGPQSSQEVPFYGRADDLQWLADQCAIAKTHKALRVLSVWGEQGMGKTHLAYRFAKALADGGYPNHGTWAAYALNKDFDSDKLLNMFPEKPTLLLCDDVSLQDADTTARLRALRKACAGRAQAIVLVVTTWSAASAGGITADQILVDAERPCGGLALDFAKQIYPNARELPANMQGHPLYLRLLAAQAPAKNLAPDSLWDLCQRWGTGYNSRLQTEHGLTDNALAALAVVSSSDTGVLTDIAKVIGLTKGDFAALEKTGRVSFHQGAKVLNPIKPDLLGWAFALSALENLPASQSDSYANLAWENDFFDTGRFMEHAVQMGYPQHAWAKALRQAPADSLSERGAMARAAAATNAVFHYGNGQRFTEMAAELSIAQAVAKRFADNTGIQLARASAATNAISDYGSHQRFAEMAAELAIAQDISERFDAHPAIQIARIRAASNAVVRYGSHQRFPEMAAELAIAQAISLSYAKHTEIQLQRAKAATSAAGYYGSHQRFPQMAQELNVAHAIALIYADCPQIQLARAKAASNAIEDYGSSQRFTEMAAELAIVSAIAQRYAGHTEIQLARAISAANAASCYGSCKRFTEMVEQLAVLQAIAVSFVDHSEIQLTRAKAATNAMLDYASQQRITDLASELAVVKKIAANYSANSEIQTQLARSYVIQIEALSKNDRQTNEATAALVQHFASYPELSKQPPFDELLAALTQDLANESQ